MSVTRLGLLIAALIATIALAASVHFKGRVSFTDNGLTLTAVGALAGLGNGDVVIDMTATANPTATCTNQGGNTAPGQNPAAVTVGGQTAIPDSEIKNGNTPFTVTTNAPAQPTWDQAGCPSQNWTAAITDLAFTSATIKVYQNGILVLQQTFTP
jgi:hypothetical protein